ncbi:XTP/dITP diphosphatase [Effusibacillus lacus]|uniref:dITP/XTP pyrophosphatase n=1 Tax=Effusibacillus lacus TaxID=1348429 RepID=A0A292YQC6_9BACL|nr:XTP/dITP diphosphatase [Effusibacillus lacus]TCS70052.1 XTP/dITP diphosphohydrolase [Effusibacillus lacus]GAX91109.1 non-canonical purine NTP pyrophosphatase [Effusibacillus lacus]
MQVILATRNQGKVREFDKALSELGWTVSGLPDNTPPVVEDGLTFEANARKKAETIAQLLQVPVLADDSGLEVDALGGRPGVYSARYAGEHASDADNNHKLLQELAGVAPDKRTARFVCALAFSNPGSPTLLARGECEGVILTEARGEGGFGYDPIFCVPDLRKTFGELDLDEKNRISHRAKAIRSLLELLSVRDPS